MAKIPNTIAVKWKNKDGSRSLKYRVRINRQGLKVDELVETEEQALELVNQARSKFGQANIKIEQKKKEEEKKYLTDNTSLDYLVSQYVEQEFAKSEHDTELQKRNKCTKRSLYKKILDTKIRFDKPDPDIDVKIKNLASLTPQAIADFAIAVSNNISLLKKRIGDFSVFDFDNVAVNDYIREKKNQGRAGSSILTDITAMSSFYRKLRKNTRNTLLKNINNPCLDYDHDLLKNAIKKRAKRISDEELRIIYEAMASTENIEMFQIVLLALYSSCRRSEIITLRVEQVFENHLHLIFTKSGKERDVYLTKQAKDLLATITPQKDGRLFSYTIAGFDRNWRRLRKKFNFEHILFSDLRKESISRFVESLAGTNSMVIAELLGVSNVEKLEQDYIYPVLEKPNVDTERGMLKSIGHANKKTTLKFYYSIADKTK